MKVKNSDLRAIEFREESFFPLGLSCINHGCKGHIGLEALG